MKMHNRWNKNGQEAYEMVPNLDSGQQTIKFLKWDIITNLLASAGKMWIVTGFWKAIGNIYYNLKTYMSFPPQIPYLEINYIKIEVSMCNDVKIWLFAAASFVEKNL